MMLLIVTVFYSSTMDFYVMASLDSTLSVTEKRVAWITRNEFESVELRSTNLEPVMQSEISQK